ncbi:MAG: NAD(P)H-binding protein [Actinomycetota bacterium]|nr:NAD(P)H-binding protein [Actinomycetota bacterium]
MRIFLAGATGAIGRPLLRMLPADGHTVTAMTRSAQKAEALRAAGAEPVVCDAYDADGVRAAMAEARPDVVVHQLTDIPPRLDVRRYHEQTAGNDHPARLRDWLPAYAETLGAKRPLRVPVWLARLGGGPVAVRLAAGRGASNAKARHELGWEPRYRSWRQGFREALG